MSFSELKLELIRELKCSAFADSLLADISALKQELDAARAKNPALKSSAQHLKVNIAFLFAVNDIEGGERRPWFESYC